MTGRFADKRRQFDPWKQEVQNMASDSAKRLNRVISKGKQYVYHRPTGTRLPSLSEDHPEFIAAYQSAEEMLRIQTSAPKRFGPTAHLKHISIKDVAPPVDIDAIAYHLKHVVQFIFAARQGNIIYYHAGNIAVDAGSDPVVYDKQRYAQLMHTFGLLDLRRSKVATDWYQYFAVRTDTPAGHTPKAATAARVTPDEYEALVAVMERQAALSVSRAIRDHVGLSDEAARKMRNDMINRGWITNTRPPELTDLGLHLLA